MSRSPVGLSVLDEPQITLKDVVEAQGRGVHTGEPCSVRILPAAAGSGLVFRDAARRHGFVLSAGALLPASRCTVVGVAGFEVMTVEHMLAALFGLGIDNAEVIVDGREIPILDGSAAPWVELFLEAGLEEQSEPAVACVVTEPVVMHCGASRIEAGPQAGLWLTVTTEYDHPLLGEQTYSAGMDRDTFIRDIAPARTFALAEEVETVLARGLARGADLTNTVVVYQDRFSDALRVENECLRHKVLDVIGDLCVLGRRVHARIAVRKPGHAVSAKLVQRLAVGCDSDPLI